MVGILRASPMGKEDRYLSKLEMRAKLEKIIDYYPMLRDDDPTMPYVSNIFLSKPKLWAGQQPDKPLI